MSSDVTAGRWTTSFKKNSGKYASAEKAILAAQAFAEEAEERQKLAARAAEEQEAGASRSSEAATSVRAYTVQLQDVPRVFPPEETIAGAAKRAAKVQGNEALRTEGERAGNRAARRLDALMKELTSRLGGYMRGFPRYSALHPFNRKLLDLVTGRQNYERILAKVDSLRKAVVQVAKSYAAKASAAKSVEEAERMEKAGFQAVREVFARGKYGVEELMKVAKAFRQIPTIDPLVPTVALVGAPNVGKSSLVQVMSSGLPEVCHYPFTTRSIKMGHFYVDGRRHQVTDTPGVLARPDEERNTMEMLTLATLDHLPTAVLFVADLTEECGTSVSDQWRIRQELKQRYPDKLWVDVLSKQDLLEWEFEEAGPPLPMETATSESPCDAAEELGDVEDAVQFARRLPRAHRVSSLTNAGIDDLKSSVIDMLSARNLGEQLEQLSAREQDRLNTPDPSSAPFAGSNVA